jgi:hypothetical protein
VRWLEVSSFEEEETSSEVFLMVARKHNISLQDLMNRLIQRFHHDHHENEE